MYTKRTDLAIDAAQVMSENESDIIKKEEYQLFNLPATKIIIDNEIAVKTVSKPMGTYITIHMSSKWHTDRNEGMNAAKAISHEISKMLPKNGTILVVGLGNMNITADNIGPKACNKIIVTRHLKEQMPENFIDFHSVAAVSPGVLGLTGIETGEIIKGTCDIIAPLGIIAIDALATSDTKRLCATFQITDAGITPGSGVGNFRFSISKENLSIPVIAIGIPTVVESSVLVSDILESHGLIYEEREETPPMIVTPKDIDVLSDKAANIIATAINLALHEKIDPKELMDFME